MARTLNDGNPVLLHTLPTGRGQRRLALAVIGVSIAIFAATAPFATLPLPPVQAFIPIYESAIVISDLITAVLLLGQFNVMRSPALLVLGGGYLFTAFTAIAHALTFPGLFAPHGLLGAGPQSTAWLYMFWHGGFPLTVIAYALLKDAPVAPGPKRTRSGIAIPATVVAMFLVVVAFTIAATAGGALLPEIMNGSHYTPVMFGVVSSVWALSLAALFCLWRRSHSVLDLWLMVVMWAWLFDIALSAVLNAGRFDLGFYAGRIYGLLAASFVLMVLLLENGMLHARLAEERERERRRAAEALARHAERLRLLHDIDCAILAAKSLQSIAEAAIQPLCKLLDVPHAIVSTFDLEAGEVEWLAVAGCARAGPGERYSIRLMGNVEALSRGETQVIDALTLPPDPGVDALLAFGVHVYMAVPMIANGELIGAISFGGRDPVFPAEQVAIAREGATQLAIAITHARLFEQVKRHTEELELRVLERTAQLRESEERHRAVVDTAVDGIIVIDEQGVIHRFNPGAERMFGYLEAEVTGRNVSMLMPSPHREQHDGYLEKFLTTGEKRFVGSYREVAAQRKDGTVFPLYIGLGEMRLGEHRMFTGVARDITDAKRVAERQAHLVTSLEAANKELESFSYSVSHDLRAPLRAIDGYSQILMEDHADKLDGEGQRVLTVIRENSRKMGTLIDDLLAFSRLGRKPLALSDVNMGELIGEVLRELQSGDARQAPRVAVEDLPPARGDRVLLKQVWMNLLSNALKFACKKDAPHVEVRGYMDGVENVYSVKDNGAGFDMRYYDKLFGVFQRLHSDDEFPGTGVGLAIVHRVVSRHGGRVWAEGKIDAGATFHFALPQGDVDGRHAAS